ncbi:MAG TPA: purine phosphoribosyltransferase family protein [archaeon]|nr:purine phosphoribosyltransferase family protein [archaeon]
MGDINFADYFRNVPDFPKPGIQFKDATPLLGKGRILYEACRELRRKADHMGAEAIVGIDARGFIMATGIAIIDPERPLGLYMARKVNKLPVSPIDRDETHREVFEMQGYRVTVTPERVIVQYGLEYGSDALEMHRGDHDGVLKPGTKTVVADDIVATGGTMGAAIVACDILKADVVGALALGELGFLNGRERLRDCPLETLVKF